MNAANCVCRVPIYLQNLVSGVVLLKTKHSLLYLKKNTAQKGNTVPSKLKLLILYSSIMYVTWCDVMVSFSFQKFLSFVLDDMRRGCLYKRGKFEFFHKYKPIMHNQYNVRKHYFVAEEKVPKEKVYNNLFEICSSASPKNLRAEALPWRHLKCFLILTNPYRQQWHQQPVSASAPSLPGKIVKLLLLFKASKVRGWFQECGKSLPSHFKDTRHSPISATGCYKLTL